MRLYTFLLLIPLALGAPTVTIQNGTVIGYTLGDVESFKGIPFAQPPVGARRLKPPAPLVTGFGTITAGADGQPCPTLGLSSSVPSTVRSALATTTPSDKDFFPDARPGGPPSKNGPEDCLFINVQRPVGTTKTSKLPVFVWIYGGGFVGGATSLYDGAALVSKAKSLSEPFLYVVFNYRLAAFGWLAGKELSDEGSTNNGLRDQRLAMQWVQDNIEAFGGDPTKVTIGGESAGAISVFDHLLVNNGNNLYRGKPLFTGAIMDSGVSFPTFPVRHPRPQGQFDKVVQVAGCSSATNKLQCLRSVSYDTFFAAQNAAAGSFQQVGLSYPPRPDPASTFFPVSSEKGIASGTYAKVPMIIGAQSDEGTLFALGLSQYASSTDRIVDLLTQQCPDLTRENATAFVNTYPGTYPERITQGAPFGTGYANELYPGFKRIAALYGDATFGLSRRIALDSIAGKNPVWSFIATYEQNLPFLGTTHGSDVFCTFFSLGPAAAVIETQVRYLSFIRYGDPNILGVNKHGSSYTQWPGYTLASRQLLNFGAFGPYYTTDNFRQQSYLILKSNYSAIAF